MSILTKADLIKYVQQYKINYLYYTSVVYNEKSQKYFDDTVRDSIEKGRKFPLPEFGHYMNLEDLERIFTVTPSCNLLSPWMGYDEVFLRYKVTKPLILFDFPSYLSSLSKDEKSSAYENMYTFCKKTINTMISLDITVDGYLDEGDCVHVFLLAENECIEDEQVIQSTDCFHSVQHRESLCLEKEREFLYSLIAN